MENLGRVTFTEHGTDTYSWESAPVGGVTWDGFHVGFSPEVKKARWVSRFRLSLTLPLVILLAVPAMPYILVSSGTEMLARFFDWVLSWVDAYGPYMIPVETLAKGQFKLQSWSLRPYRDAKKAYDEATTSTIRMRRRSGNSGGAGVYDIDVNGFMKKEWTGVLQPSTPKDEMPV